MLKTPLVQVFLFIAIVYFIFAFFHDSKERIANQIIEKIEEYELENGEVPDSLENIGILEREEGPVYYEKQNGEEYIIWYGLSLGESMTYDSETKTWKGGG